METVAASFTEASEKFSPKLPAFKTIVFGYRFVVDEWRVLVRIGWRDFLASIAFFAASLALDAILFGETGELGFTYAVIPLAGYFVIGFAVRCHRYYMNGEEPEDAASEVRTAILAYGILLVKCIGLLLLPLALAAFIPASLELPEIWLVGLAAPAILLDFYLAARMSIFFPIAAIGGHVPMRDFWFFSKGYAWKLFLILAFAPWPISLALKLIEWLASGQSLLLQVPLYVVAALLSFIGIAVLAIALSRAFYHCRAGQDAQLERLSEEWADDE
ncbi:MAG: hypothetical protein ACK4NA_09150 [Alphaproteobacteria bacterium]